MKEFTIPGRLPGLNEYIATERSNKYIAANLKRDFGKYVKAAALRQLRGYKAEKPVILHYTWYEESRRRDLDNISGMGHKIIQDALVSAGILDDDGWKFVVGFTDVFRVDRKAPRIIVRIEEIEQEGKDDED